WRFGPTSRSGRRATQALSLLQTTGPVTVGVGHFRQIGRMADYTGARREAPPRRGQHPGPDRGGVAQCPGMAAVWARARAELRGKARTMAVLALVVGVAGGAALTAFAGARRTDSAVDRFVAYSHSPDANVGPRDPAVLD